MVYDVIVVVDDRRTAPSRDVREIIGSIDLIWPTTTTTYLSNQSIVMPPTLKKWGTYWFRLVRVCVCGGGGGGGGVGGGASRYRLETSCMDSTWKNSRRVFLVFPELSPLVKLRPFDKQGDGIL